MWKSFTWVAASQWTGTLKSVSVLKEQLFWICVCLPKKETPIPLLLQKWFMILSPSDLFLYEVLAVVFVLCTLWCCQFNEKEMTYFPSLLVLTLFLFGFVLLDFYFFFLYRCWYSFIAVGENVVCGLGVLICFVFFEEKIASWDFNLCQFTYQLFSCFYESYELWNLWFMFLAFCGVFL